MAVDISLFGPQLLLAVAVAALVIAVFLMASHNDHDWRWLRWPLVTSIILLALLSTFTPEWPLGLAAESCTDVANPALENDATAQPQILQICGPPSVTGGAPLLAVALALFLLGPEISEVGVPGLLSLKKRIIEQEEKSSKIESRVTQLATSASAKAEGKFTNEVTFVMDAVRRGQVPKGAAAVARVVKLTLEGILDFGSGQLPIDGRMHYYRHVGGGLLRDYFKTEPGPTDFLTGNGATGQAWRDIKTIVVTGDAVHNADYGLTSEQQNYFEELTIVGSTPIFDLDGRRVVGALTGSSSEDLDSAPESNVTERFRDALETTARLLSVVVVAFDLDEGA